MTSLMGRLRELSPFYIADHIRAQANKDKRIERLEVVSGYVEQRVEAKKNHMKEHTERLVQTVKDALEDFDEFRGKCDD